MLKEQNQHQQETCAFLQVQLDALKRMIFGSKSERYIDPESKQVSLFDDNSFTEIEANGKQITDESVTVAFHTRQKQSKPIMEELNAWMEKTQS